MSETIQTSPASPGPSVAPTLKLSRRGLIVSLLTMLAAGLLVYSIFPSSVGGSPLPVQVKIGRRPVETIGQQGAVLTEVLIVENLSQHAIPKLKLEVNGQYLLFRDSPLEQNEKLVVPLRVFTDKRSSQRYDPQKYPPQEVIVAGQLPSGARGLTQFHIDPNTREGSVLSH
ncbi:MAG: hypothetical protein MI861_29200 [Pirellulales bacterium]|nr:hypothetical protein [Pirellulales bacterium]